MGHYTLISFQIAIKPHCLDKIDDIVDDVYAILEANREWEYGSIKVKLLPEDQAKEILRMREELKKIGQKTYSYPYTISAFGVFYVHGSTKHDVFDFIRKWEDCIDSEATIFEYLPETVWNMIRI